MIDDRRFPCLDGHRYSGCVGLDSCPAERCWNGRRLRHRGPIVPDAFDRPPKPRYTGAPCASCQHAVDVQVQGELRAASGRVIERWTMCEEGLWTGPISLYNLVSHRAPIALRGPCPSYLDTPREQLRPELVQRLTADRDRARARRAERRAAQKLKELVAF